MKYVVLDDFTVFDDIFIVWLYFWPLSMAIIVVISTIICYGNIIWFLSLSQVFYE